MASREFGKIPFFFDVYDLRAFISLLALKIEPLNFTANRVVPIAFLFAISLNFVVLAKKCDTNGLHFCG